MINEPFIKALEEPENLEAHKEYEMIEKALDQTSNVINPMGKLDIITTRPNSN